MLSDAVLTVQGRLVPEDTKTQQIQNSRGVWSAASVRRCSFLESTAANTRRAPHTPRDQGILDLLKLSFCLVSSFSVEAPGGEAECQQDSVALRP